MLLEKSLYAFFRVCFKNCCFKSLKKIIRKTSLVAFLLNISSYPTYPPITIPKTDSTVSVSLVCSLSRNIRRRRCLAIMSSRRRLVIMSWRRLEGVSETKTLHQDERLLGKRQALTGSLQNNCSKQGETPRKACNCTWKGLHHGGFSS